jgi:predicted RNA-binding Zn-ribbon protein involved in translation (DUF1610 family)
MIKIYSSPYIVDCDQLRMLLSSAGIRSEMRNEFGHPIGLAALGGAAEFAAPEVWIDGTNHADAAEIVRRFTQTITRKSRQPADATIPEWVCPHCGETVITTFSACWKCDTPRPEN